MKHRVAVFNTRFMDECVRTALEPFADRCEFAAYYYGKSSDIPGIYEEIEKDFDGFLVNGAVSRAILSRSFPEERKPVETIHMDVLSYYRELLKLTVTAPGFRFERAYVDFINGDNLRDRIADGTLDTIANRCSAALETMPLEDLLNLRHQLLEQAEQAWKAGRIDLVITRFSTVMDELRERGIPCFFVFPGEAYIREVADRLLSRLDVERLKRGRPAVIRIGRGGRHGAGGELFDLKLQRAVLEFSLERHLDFAVRKKDAAFEVMTSAGVVDDITDHYTACGLKLWLEEAVEGTVCIGYGIGHDMERARRAAADAGREAAQSPTESSFLIDERDRLIGPLAAGRRLVLAAAPAPEYERLAEATGLSALTLQKVCAVAEKEEGRIVTAQILADRLGLTVRAASKYLQKLVVGGAAQVVGRKQRKTRGRPEQLVHIGAVGQERRGKKV